MVNHNEISAFEDDLPPQKDLNSLISPFIEDPHKLINSSIENTLVSASEDKLSVFLSENTIEIENFTSALNFLIKKTDISRIRFICDNSLITYSYESLPTSFADFIKNFPKKDIIWEFSSHPLIICSSVGRIEDNSELREIVNYLIDFLKTNPQSSDIYELFMFFCEVGNYGIASVIHREVQNISDTTLNMLMFYASSGNFYGVSNTMIQQRKEKPYDFILHRNSAIECAAKNGNWDIVFIILHEGVSDCVLQNVFWEAVKKNRVEVAEILLNTNAVNIDANSGYALRESCKSGSFDMVKMLIERGSDIHIEFDAPLSIAYGNGRYDLVDLLLKDKNNDCTTK